MLFQNRIDRAQKWLHDRAAGSNSKKDTGAEGDLPSPEQLKMEAQEEMDLEKGDFAAMLIAAFVTIVPICLLVLLVMVLGAAIGYL